MRLGSAVACAHREQPAARPRPADLTGQLPSSTAPIRVLGPSAPQLLSRSGAGRSRLRLSHQLLAVGAERPATRGRQDARHRRRQPRTMCPARPVIGNTYGHSYAKGSGSVSRSPCLLRCVGLLAAQRVERLAVVAGGVAGRDDRGDHVEDDHRDEQALTAGDACGGGDGGVGDRADRGRGFAGGVGSPWPGRWPARGSPWWTARRRTVRPASAAGCRAGRPRDGRCRGRRTRGSEGRRLGRRDSARGRGS